MDNRIRLNYENYDTGKIHYDNLINYIEIAKKQNRTIKNNYLDLDSSSFDIYSFPINMYISDLDESIKCSEEIIKISDKLATYAVDNFKDAEEATQEEIDKFLNKREELYANINSDGYHFESEKIVYWEPGIAGYTSQGYTETDNYKIVSAYKIGENSRLYYYDKETGKYIGYVELNNKAHVGGITYDQDDKILFVTGSDGEVNCYDHEAIEQALATTTKGNDGRAKIDLNSENYSGVELDCNININELGIDDPATIYYHDGKLYVSTYRKKGDLVSYDIKCNRTSDGKVEVDGGQMHIISTDSPSATQGISIFEKDGKKYVAFARSAMVINSSIDVYELNDDETLGKMSGSISLPHTGLEGIKVHEDGTVTGIYEFEGATTLDVNIDNILGNGKENPLDKAYEGAGAFWETKHKVEKAIEDLIN